MLPFSINIYIGFDIFVGIILIPFWHRDLGNKATMQMYITIIKDLKQKITTIIYVSIYLNHKICFASGQII